jgi:alcohol dehydrogenase
MYGFGIAGGLWGGVIADQVAVPFADAMLVPLPGGIEVAASVGDNVSDGYRHIAPYLPALLAVDVSASRAGFALALPAARLIRASQGTGLQG